MEERSSSIDCPLEPPGLFPINADMSLAMIVAIEVCEQSRDSNDGVVHIKEQFAVAFESTGHAGIPAVLPGRIRGWIKIVLIHANGANPRDYCKPAPKIDSTQGDGPVHNRAL